MYDMLLVGGRVAGFVGLVICAVGAAVRISGQYWVGGFQVGTLLLAGVAAMIAGCFLLLVALTANPAASR